jgi:hypothetical protein
MPVIERIGKNLFDTLRHNRHATEIHHSGRTANGVRAPEGLFERLCISWLLLETVEVSLDLGQICRDLVQEALEDRELVEVRRHERAPFPLCDRLRHVASHQAGSHTIVA